MKKGLVIPMTFKIVKVLLIVFIAISLIMMAKNFVTSQEIDKNIEYVETVEQPDITCTKNGNEVDMSYSGLVLKLVNSEKEEVDVVPYYRILDGSESGKKITLKNEVPTGELSDSALIDITKKIEVDCIVECFNDNDCENNPNCVCIDDGSECTDARAEMYSCDFNGQEYSCLKCPLKPEKTVDPETLDDPENCVKDCMNANPCKDDPNCICVDTFSRCMNFIDENCYSYNLYGSYYNCNLSKLVPKCSDDNPIQENKLSLSITYWINDSCTNQYSDVSSLFRECTDSYLGSTNSELNCDGN